MSLKIFGDGEGPKAGGGGKFSDDIVGRFRSGYQSGEGKKKTPVALQEWRVTTGDPEVADKIAAMLEADEAPAEWDATGEDNLEVFGSKSEVEILLSKPSDLRQAMILWGRNGKIIRKSDGETILYPEEQKGQPDPQAGQTLAERKKEAKDGVGAEPQIEIYFRLADDPDLGIFKFQSGSWSMVSDLAYDGTEEKIVDLFEDNPDADYVSATLGLEEVSFEAKSGPMAGKTVTFTKPTLSNLKAVEA